MGGDHHNQFQEFTNTSPFTCQTQTPQPDVPLHSTAPDLKQCMSAIQSMLGYSLAARQTRVKTQSSPILKLRQWKAKGTGKFPILSMVRHCFLHQVPPFSITFANSFAILFYYFLEFWQNICRFPPVVVSYVFSSPHNQLWTFYHTKKNTVSCHK